MVRWIVFFCLILFVILDGDNVLILNDQTFEDAIEKNPIIMVKFYAPWCGHCKKLAPEYEKLAIEIKKKSMPYVIAKLDAEANPKTTASQNIGSYPTIKLYIKGKPFVYGGERTVDAIIEFIGKKTAPFSTLLKTVEEIEGKKNPEKPVSILATTDNETINIYVTVGQRLGSYDYYHADPNLLAQIFPGVKQGSLIVLKNFDEGQAEYNGLVTEEAIESFLNLHKDHVVTETTQEVIKDVFNTGKRTGIFLIRENTYSNLDAVESEFHKAALALRSHDFIFVKTDIKDGLEQRVSAFLGIGECSNPIILIVKKDKEFLIYRYEGKIVAEDIKKFIENYKEGKLERYFKSENEPLENPGPVYKAVGKTFKREVLDNDLDVIVKFYAPWCVQCKRLAPVYKSLADDLKTNQKLKFVEIDATKNDVEGHMIRLYPTIKLFPGKNKANVQVYSGNRNEDDIKKFIMEKGSYPELFNEKKSDL